MAQVRDVVTYFLRKSGGTAPPISVHKLVYYAQAWHLVWSGEALFESELQAWVHGPVAAEVWQIAKTAGAKRWNSAENRWELATKRPDEEPLGLNDYELSVLDAVWEKYGSLSPEQLEAMTHDEAPWIKARGSLAPSEKGQTPIDRLAMRNFYAMLQAREPEKTPRPVRPPPEARFESGARRVFDTHDKLFAALAR
jgi:uncharacterized phage-associated protein